MQKRHFEALAAALAAERREVEAQVNEISRDEFNGAIGATGDIARKIAEVCRSFNPEFDRARFLEACK